MDVHQFCKPYVWGGATFWYLPYRPLATDIAIRALEALEAQWEYQNVETGARVVGEPEEVRLKRERAETIHVPFSLEEIGWTRRRLWDERHDLFVVVLPRILSIDFNANGDASTELHLFQAFWETPYPDAAARWADFAQLPLGTETTKALWEGLNATVDNPAPASKALTDPNPTAPPGKPLSRPRGTSPRHAGTPSTPTT